MSDGTPAGTVRVPNVTGTELAVLNDWVYSGHHSRGSIVRTDGTNLFGVASTESDPYFSYNLTEAGNRIYWAAREQIGAGHGVELWSTDGTPGGTRLVKDIGQVSPGSTNTSSNPLNLFEAGGVLLFSAQDLGNGRELWRSDGTSAGTTLVRDINPGVTDADPVPLAALGDKLYFAATDFTHGREIWSVELAPPPPPPTVTGVYVSGSAWAAEFKQLMASTGVGSADFGFAIPTLYAQPRTLPWANLDQVSINFSDAVSVDAADLRITGARVSSYPLDPAAFTYDAATRTATWRLAAGQTFGNDRIRLDLDGDSPGAVRTGAGTLLDGEWNGPTPVTVPVTDGDAFPSGDGQPGGDFLYAINVLPGDVNRNGVVLADDFSDVKKRFFKDTTTPGYTMFHDVDGSGTILADDFSAVKSRFFDGLPPASAAAAAPSLDPITRDVFSANAVL